MRKEPNLSDYKAQMPASIEARMGRRTVILTDFKGVRPFNVNMLLSQGHPQVAVLAERIWLNLEAIDQALPQVQ